jgi:hypothetical protein
LLVVEQEEDVTALVTVLEVERGHIVLQQGLL